LENSSNVFVHICKVNYTQNIMYKKNKKNNWYYHWYVTICIYNIVCTLSIILGPILPNMCDTTSIQYPYIQWPIPNKRKCHGVIISTICSFFNNGADPVLVFFVKRDIDVKGQRTAVDICRQRSIQNSADYIYKRLTTSVCTQFTKSITILL
jgi:hypothetical protein